MNTPQRELPAYKSHKTVWALKIAGITPVEGSHGAVIQPQDPGYGAFGVDDAYMLRHRPEVGGYWVQYADGYQSYSPAKAFEEGYTREGALQPATPEPLEAAIAAAGADVAPRVTMADIEAAISADFFFTAADGVFGASGHRPNSVRAGTALGLLTFCVLVLKNGYTVTGESACVSPENFNAEIGRRVAREDAVRKLWPLLGYQLREQLYQRTQPAQAPV